MKVYQTNRLFYGKWVYRIETKTPGASLIKRWGVAESTDFCKNPNNSRWQRHYTTADKDQLLKYIRAVEPFFNCDLQMRAEWDTLNFYLNDSNLYNNLRLALTDWIVSVTEPANDADIESLHAKSALVLCNELPYGQYRYKVYIRYQMPPNQRLAFLSWLDNYKDVIKPSKGTIKWLSDGSPYFQDPFIYVTDQNQLLMVTLFLGINARSTQEFVLRDT
jgi:hypothetical protein